MSAADQRDLDKLVNCLNKTFEQYQDSEDARILLENRRQKERETIAEYGKALDDFARKAYPIDRDERGRALHPRLEFRLVTIRCGPGIWIMQSGILSGRLKITLVI